MQVSYSLYLTVQRLIVQQVSAYRHMPNKNAHELIDKVQEFTSAQSVSVYHHMPKQKYM